MIEFTDVRRTYQKNAAPVRALDGVSFTIQRGELVAIVGASGSGKTTLMNILGLLDRPDAGSYRLHGEPVASLSDEARAVLRNERIGFVFQSFHLLARATAEENVELPLLYSRRRRTRGLARRALERVGLGDRLQHFPGELSGGEQQRVAIARALVQEPELLLADEPTGNLDTRTGGEILSLFRELHGDGATVVMITHDPSVAALAPRRIAMADGRIVSDHRPTPLESEHVPA